MFRLEFNAAVLMLAAALFVSFPTLSSANVQSSGEVTYVRGATWIIRGETRISVKRGQSLQKGDVIVTRNSGRAKLSMADGSSVFVGRQSRLKIQDYSMRANKLHNASFSMLWGKVKFLVSKLRRQASGFEVRTKTAVIGVRGTEFAVVVNPPKKLPTKPLVKVKPNLQETKLLLFSGSVLGTSIKGVKNLVKPGSLVSFKPTGKVATRKISKRDMKLVKDLPAPEIKREPKAEPKSRPNAKVEVKPTKQTKAAPASQTKRLPKARVGLKQPVAPAAGKGLLPLPSRAPTKTPALRTPVSPKATLLTKPGGTKLVAPVVAAPSLVRPTSPSLTKPKPSIGKPVIGKPVAPVVTKPLVGKPVSPVITKPVMGRPVSPIITKPVISKPIAPVITRPVVTKPVSPVITKPVITRPVAPVITKPVITRPVVPVITKPVITKPVITRPVAPVITKPVITKPVITRPVAPVITRPVVTKPF
ncbi:MAG: FecR domain-containing protein [Ghiorsea sp.]